ncbi:glycosyltransferase family 39 protein [Gemelliphila palaticanis]|uniref:Glycosyltransferase family 39 protein n=1 Tax=Gemelliphila palaticanis TaxID=81950 RepID=A0ABX2SZX7_9BACL|nr:glycosyltransferase family 39 protein [Gemella palaticanis]MBF0714764.1 glycosyltransferase family 39 protein [Gemella palaticanis]NYS46694.1 glycosyltransferase family 39 protein [Gemella palaticanis]
MRKILHNIFSYAFISLFTLALMWIVVNPFVYERILNPIALLLGIPVVFITIIAIARKILSSDNETLNKYNKIIAISYVIFQAIILSMDTLNFSDGAEIENEAHYMLNYGRFSGERYFLVYPNNINPTIILYWIYRIANFLGISEVLALHFFCFMVTTITMFLIFKTAGKLFDKPKQTLVLLLTLIYIPFQMYSLFYYSDTFMVILVALIMYVLIPSDGSFIFRSKHIIAVAIIIAFGWNLRSNIIIVLPALLIYLMFFKWYKKVALLLISFAISFILFGKGFDMLWNYYGFFQDDGYRFPMLHWVMMGMSIQGGSYNWQDFQYTYLSQDKAADDLSLFFNRVFHRPLFLNLVVFVLKIRGNWSDGTINYTNGTRALREGDGFLWQLFYGSHNSIFIYTSQMLYAVIIFSMVYYMYKRRKDYITSMFLFQIILFGVFMFHLIWEAKPRYVYAWMPLIFILAARGISIFIEVNNTTIFNKYNKKLYIAFGIVFAIQLTSDSYLRPSYSMNLDYDSRVINGISIYATDNYLRDGIVRVNQTNVVEQTFDATMKFNYIRAYISSYDENNNSKYKVEIVDKNTNKVVREKTFIYRELYWELPLQTYTLRWYFDDLPKGNYSVKFSQVENVDNGSIVISSVPNEMLDMYTSGKLYINDVDQNKKDLALQIGRRFEKLWWY